MTDNHPLLRALRMNAVFSGASALAMLVAGGWIAAHLGLGSALPVYIVAGVLLLFTLQLLLIVRSREIRTWEIVSIIASDLAWVIASVVLVALFFEQLTATGLLLVDVVAVAVLAFAVMQIRGLRIYRRSTQRHS